jgi:hypothetical protein
MIHQYGGLEEAIHSRLRGYGAAALTEAKETLPNDHKNKSRRAGKRGLSCGVIFVAGSQDRRKERGICIARTNGSQVNYQIVTANPAIPGVWKTRRT